MDRISARQEGGSRRAPLSAARLARRGLVAVAALVVGLAAFALQGGSANADHPFPNCPSGTIPFYGHFPGPGNTIIDVSTCIPLAATPVGGGTPRTSAPGSNVAFITPTPVLATATRPATQTPQVITIVVTATPPPATGIRPPNTGDGGLAAPAGQAGAGPSNIVFSLLAGCLAIAGAGLVALRVKTRSFDEAWRRSDSGRGREISVLALLGDSAKEAVKE